MTFGNTIFKSARFSTPNAQKRLGNINLLIKGERYDYL